MPILAKKDNPPSKPFDSVVLDTSGTWWVAKVKPRQEKMFAFELLEQGINYCLPYYEKKTKRSDGKLRVTFQILFSSYVPFIADNPYNLLNKKRIVSVLRVVYQSRFKEQLHQIFRAIESNYQIITIPQNEYQIGDLVKVNAGPLIGVTGNIIKIGNIKSLMLSVNGLGQVVVSVPRCYIDRIENTRINRINHSN